MGEYKKSNIISNLRKKSNLTRSSLSDGICDELTLIRYETGVLDPSDRMFFNLMARMGQQGDLYLLPFTQENLQYLSLQRQIEECIQRDDLDKCEQYLASLISCEEFDLSIPTNQQYYERINSGISFFKHTLSPVEYVNASINALRITIPEFNLVNCEFDKILTDNEIQLLNNTATASWLSGDEEKSFLLFEKLIQTLSTNLSKDTAKMSYKCFLNYSNILGRTKHYERCIEVCKLGLEYLYNRDCQNLIYNFYFNIGWVYSKLSAETAEPNNYKSLASAYSWMSYVLCDFYNESANSKKKIHDFYLSLNS